MVKKLDKEDVSPTIESAGDKAHRVGRAIASVIPAGGELLNSLITPPLERRREKWMLEVTSAVNELLQNGNLTIEDLENNEQFITTVLHATNAAVRNHQNEKIEALKNAVMNSALPNAPENSLQQMFLSMVDSLTEWHIKILKLFQSPEKWATENDHDFPNWSNGSLVAVIENAFPELKGQRDFYDQIWRDLNDKGLVSTDSLQVGMSANGMMSSRTTSLGDKFVQFITNRK